MTNKNSTPILIVTGKGGVGKSFTAALLAKKLSLDGKKTLLVDMVPESYLASSLKINNPKRLIDPQKTVFGFDYALWLGESCLAEYIQYWVKIPWMSQSFLKNQWLNSLVHLAPGLREIAFLGKLTSQARKHGPLMNYDHIVVDGVSTGHFLSLIKTPLAFVETVSSGPMHEQSLQIHRVLSDPQQTTIFVVSNLERYSLSESEELGQQLQQALNAAMITVANKIYPVPQDLEITDQAMPPDLQSFLRAQNEIKKYQSEAISILETKSERVFRVPFYFEYLRDVLERKDEVRNLF